MPEYPFMRGVIKQGLKPYVANIWATSRIEQYEQCMYFLHYMYVVLVNMSIALSVLAHTLCASHVC